MANIFGKRSKECRKTMHPDLQAVFNLAIRRSPVDFGIHEGARTIEKQREYFKEGSSRVNPDAYRNEIELAKKGKHIVIPGNSLYSMSRAGDIHVAEKHKGKGLTWDEIHLGFVAGVIISCAQELYEAGETTHLVRWGGDWDADGVIALDHKLKDMPHFELLKP